MTTPGPRTCDVLIIGGGMAGLSLAASVASDRRVIVVESEDAPGYHATGRSAAVYVPNYGGPLVRAISALGRPALDHPDPAFFQGSLLHPRGLVRLVKAAGETEYRQAMTGAVGIEDISLTQAAEMFPLIDPSRFTAASYEDDVHDIDVHGLLQGYARQARSLDAEILTGSAVARISRSGTGWRVCAGTETFEAGVLVNAAGAWVDRIAELAGIKPIGIRPCRRSVAVLPLPEAGEPSTRWPMVVPFPLDWYAKAESGRLLVSTAEEEEVPPQDAMVDDLVLAEGLHRFEEDVTTTVTRVESSWAGLRSFSPDGIPAIGFDPEVETFFWYAGQGGFGIQAAPGLAVLGQAMLNVTGKHRALTTQLDIRRLREGT